MTMLTDMEAITFVLRDHVHVGGDHIPADVYKDNTEQAWHRIRRALYAYESISCAAQIALLRARCDDAGVDYSVPTREMNELSRAVNVLRQYQRVGPWP